MKCVFFDISLPDKLAFFFHFYSGLPGNEIWIYLREDYKFCPSTMKKEATISEALYSLQGQPVTVVAANSSSGSPKVRKVALYL